MFHVRLLSLGLIAMILGTTTAQAQSDAAVPTVTSPQDGSGIAIVSGDPIVVDVTIAGKWGVSTFPDSITVYIKDSYTLATLGTKTVPVTYDSYFSSTGTATARVSIPSEYGDYIILVDTLKGGALISSYYGSEFLIRTIMSKP